MLSFTRCNTCSYVHNTNMIFGPNGRYIKIHDRYSCISEAVVYCISCELCDSLYIGQTCRRLADRITEHLRDIKINNIDKPVSRHFNSPGHSIKNFRVCILKEVKKYRPPHPVRKFYHKRPKHRIPFWNEFGLIIITYEQ